MKKYIFNNDFFFREIVVFCNFELFKKLNGLDLQMKKMFNENKTFIESVYNQTDSIIKLRNNIYRKILLSGKVIEQSAYHNSNGTIACEACLVNNIINGYRRFYYPNGKIKHEENYLNGDLDGVCKSWDENGILIKTSIYKNGKRLK